MSKSQFEAITAGIQDPEAKKAIGSLLGIINSQQSQIANLQKQLAEIQRKSLPLRG